MNPTEQAIRQNIAKMEERLANVYLKSASKSDQSNYKEMIRNETAKLAKHNAAAVEIKWDKPEPFALVVQQSTDGERVVREKQQLEADRKANKEKQLSLI